MLVMKFLALKTLFLLFGTVLVSKADSKTGEEVPGSDTEQLLSKIYSYVSETSSRQSGYGLVKFEGQTTSEDLGDQNKYGLVTFEGQNNQPFKFEDQSVGIYSSGGLYPQNNGVRDEVTFQADNYQQDVNQGVQNPQKKRKKRRRRKPRVQQSSQAQYPAYQAGPGQNPYGNSGYIGNPGNPSNYAADLNNNGYPVNPGNPAYAGFPGNPAFTGLPYRHPRRPRPSSTLSSVIEALTSVTVNDDYQCLPMLVCQAAARGIFGNSSFLQYSQLNSLVTAYGAISSSPVLVFGRAAILGITAKDDPDSCTPKYPLCPSDPQALVYYLNNHKGGFFRFFRSPGIRQIYNQILPGQNSQLNLPNYINQLAPQLQNPQAQNYGFYHPNPISNSFPNTQYPDQQQYGLYPNDLYNHQSPASGFQGQGLYNKYRQNNGANYPYEKSKVTIENVENEIDNDENENKRSDEYTSKFSTRNMNEKRINFKFPRELLKTYENNTYPSVTFIEKEAYHTRVAGTEIKRLKRYPQINSEHEKFLKIYRTRRSAQPQQFPSPTQQNPWYQYPESPLSDSQSTMNSLIEATTPSVTFPETINALEYVIQKDDRHCLLLMICEHAARGFLDVGKVGSDLYSNFMKSLANMKQAGQAAMYGFNVTHIPDACSRRYPQCPTDKKNLISYMKNYRGGFEKFFNKKNFDEFYKTALDDQLRSRAERLPHPNNQYYSYYPKQSNVQSNVGNKIPQPNYGSYQSYNYNGYFQSYPSPYTQKTGTYHKTEPFPQKIDTTFQNQGLYSRHSVDYGHIYPSYTRRQSVSTNNRHISNQLMNKKIQKRIQNHKVNVEDYIDSPYHGTEWRFPEAEINTNNALHTIRDGKQLKFPMELEKKEEGKREAQGFSFPGVQSNRQYLNSYDSEIDNDDYKSDDALIKDIRTLRDHNNNNGVGLETVYIVRGNGDPNHPEVIILRPGEMVM